jgi:hypothetical protein
MHRNYVIRFHFLIHSIFDGKLPFKSFFFLLFCISASFSSIAAVDFSRDIQPIFAEHCSNCHGPDKQKGGLNLTEQDSVLSELKSGNHPVIAGKPNQSELMRRLTTRDEDDLMPPPDKGKKLSDSKIATIRKWITEGAEWSVHWAYRQPGNISLPDVASSDWIKNEIDHFVLAKLETHKLQPSPRADRYILIKRLSYDLLGLPPSPKEVDAFVNDKSPDAYLKLVNRLLASPHFGERWGRHWLDKARYADSDGYEKDRPRPNAWRYRDWVISAINDDLPFDQFTIEQLAGDLLPESTDAQKIATAFNRQTLTNTEGGTDKEQWRVAAVMDRVETLGAVWLGLTVGCARCHNHKYDLFTQKEYYQLFAYFNNGDESNISVSRSEKEHATWIKTKASHDARMKEVKAKLAVRDKALLSMLPKLEKQLRAKIESRKANPEKFHTLEFTSATGPKDVNFKQQDDGSLLVTGANPAKAKYTLEFMTDAKEITGVKIEVLPDKSLKANGPGRTDHGNFVLNDVRVYATDQEKFDTKNHHITLTSARADFAQKDWPAKNAIDGKTSEGKKGTGWAVAPQFGRAHQLILTTSKPVSFKDSTRLQVVLDQQYGSKHTIGRFRITARTGQLPNDGISWQIVKILTIEPSKRDAKQADTLLAFFRGRDAEAKKLMAELKKPAPKPPVINVRVISQRPNNPRVTHLLHRGEFKQPKDKVTAGIPSTLPSIKHRGPGDRLDLALWLVDGKNQLVPRVTINHIWANLFGQGLVRTMNDFGARGDAPTHPLMLDWLSAEFIRQKWSRKEMIRLIVSSATYQQSSIHRPELADVDANNQLLHRQNRHRVEAEIIRDLALGASGLLSRKVGGPSVFPPLPAGVAALSYANNFKWNTSKGEDRYRRGLYTFFKRTSPHPNLITFDCPDSNVTCVKRNISNTPLAALTTLNNEIYNEAAKALAKRMMSEQAVDTERIRYGFRICTARPSTLNEEVAFTKLLQQAKKYYTGNTLEAKAYNGNAEASAWATVARIMLNMDEFLTRE